MIVYRCLTSEEIISMINNEYYDKALIKGGNTFNYAGNEPYKHFFMFAPYAYYFMKKTTFFKSIMIFFISKQKDI